MFTNPNPIQLMELMEKISGSWIYAKDHKHFEKRINVINQEKTELNGRLRLIAKDKKKAKKLMESVAKSGELIESELNLEADIFMGRMLLLKKEKMRMENEVSQAAEQIEKMENEIDRLTGELLDKKEEILQNGKFFSQNSQIQNNFLCKKSKLNIIKINTEKFVLIKKYKY